jgi:hypothetical protein
MGATACTLDSYRSIIRRALLKMTLVAAYLLVGCTPGSGVYGVPVQGDPIVLSYRAQGVFASEEVIAEIAGTPSRARSLAAVSDDRYVNGTWVGGGGTVSSFGQQCRIFFLTDEHQEAPIALPRCLVP